MFVSPSESHIRIPVERTKLSSSPVVKWKNSGFIRTCIMPRLHSTPQTLGLGHDFPAETASTLLAPPVHASEISLHPACAGIDFNLLFEITISYRYVLIPYNFPITVRH
ncbi:unnamed protein product, partial [Iphiclides podalirius]